MQMRMICILWIGRRGVKQPAAMAVSAAKGTDCVPGCRRQSLIEAHHVRRAGTSGTGVKPGDEWCVPLCFVHHNDLHRRGETTCTTEWGIDLEYTATRIATASRLLGVLPTETP